MVDSPYLRTYGRAKPMSDDPSWLEKLSHWLRFYETYEKGCGCTFWCDRALTNPANYPETTIRDVTVVTVEQRAGPGNYMIFIEKRVADCICLKCGEQFYAYIPFTTWEHHEPDGEPRELVNL